MMPNALAFCQWESKSIKLPIIQSINNKFEMLMDSIIESEKRHVEFTDSSNFYIYTTKLPKDTAMLYLYIACPSNIDKLLYDLHDDNIIAFTKYRNYSFFIVYNELPSKLFAYSGDFKSFTFKKHYQSQKRKKNQIPIINIEMEESWWKYYFYQDTFYFLDSFSW